MSLSVAVDKCSGVHLVEPGQGMQLLSLCSAVKGRGFGEEQCVSGRCVGGTIACSFRTGLLVIPVSEERSSACILPSWAFWVFLPEPC